MKLQHSQRGAFLVLAAILLAVLLGLAALVIDVGRLHSARTEIQNAADAAALAAANELNSSTGARDRARAAARELLQHDSRFANTAALLGNGGLPDSAFTFYCSINAQFDPAYDPRYCSNPPDAQGYSIATTDAQAKYIRIRLDPALEGVSDGRFNVDLLFLPVLGAVGISTAQAADVAAQATAGRSFYTCNVAPIGICDPWEAVGSTFRQSMRPGDAIELRGSGSGQWSNGNFGFLVPPSGQTGAAAIARYLASEDGAGCGSPEVTTQPGAMAQQTTRGINTRFDQYSGSFNGDWDDYPPAPNIVGYPHDGTQKAIDNRFGNGDWDFNSYWAGAHAGVPTPNAWSNLNRPTRRQVYDWEIANNQVPNTGPSYLGRPTPSHVSAGSTPARRLIKIAILSCNALGFGGRSNGIIRDPDGYANIFLYRQADGTPNLRAWGEYQSWAETTDNDYSIDVVLYD